MFNLTPRMLTLLAEMRDATAREDYAEAEIVCEGITCYLGYKQVHRTTVNELLSIVAISESNDGGSMRRYTINETGEAILRRPAIKDEIVAALLTGGSFTIVDDHIVKF